MKVGKTFFLITGISLSLAIGLATISAAYVLPQGRPAQQKSSSSPTATGAIENAAALDHFFQELAAGQPVRALQFGDSHTKADIFTGELRRSLQRDFGDGTRYTKATSLTMAERRGVTGGVRYDALGINGARAKRLLGMVETPDFLQSIALSKPDLIVLAYGTNEVMDNDWTIDSYEQMFSQIIRRLHATAPGVSILVIGPPDRTVQTGRGWAAARRMPELMEAQRRAAFNSGAAFWSACDAMGGENSMNTWVMRGLGQPDHVHLTAAGYIKLGRTLYGDLMTAYRNQKPTGAELDGLDLRVMRGVPVTKKSN